MSALRRGRTSTQRGGELAVFNARNVVRALGGRQLVGGFETSKAPKLVEAMQAAAATWSAFDQATYILDVEEFAVYIRIGAVSQ